MISRAHHRSVFVIALSFLSLQSFAEPSADAVRLSDTPVIDGDLLVQSQGVAAGFGAVQRRNRCFCLEYSIRLVDLGGRRFLPRL